MRYHSISLSIAKWKILKISNADKVAEQQELSFIDDWNANNKAALSNNVKLNMHLPGMYLVLLYHLPKEMKI